MITIWDSPEWPIERKHYSHMDCTKKDLEYSLCPMRLPGTWKTQVVVLGQRLTHRCIPTMNRYSRIFWHSRTTPLWFWIVDLEIIWFSRKCCQISKTQWSSAATLKWYQANPLLLLKTYLATLTSGIYTSRWLSGNGISHSRQHSGECIYDHY